MKLINTRTAIDEISGWDKQIMITKDDLKFLFKSKSNSACKCEERAKLAMANIQKESD